jgi:hypothetical protein
MQSVPRRCEALCASPATGAASERAKRGKNPRKPGSPREPGKPRGPSELKTRENQEDHEDTEGHETQDNHENQGNDEEAGNFDDESRRGVYPRGDQADRGEVAEALGGIQAVLRDRGRSSPETFDTPMLALLPQERRDALAAKIPFPKRLGAPADFANLVIHLAENSYINGEVIRLDGAIRMPPKG